MKGKLSVGELTFHDMSHTLMTGNIGAHRCLAVGTVDVGMTVLCQLAGNPIVKSSGAGHSPEASVIQLDEHLPVARRRYLDIISDLEASPWLWLL